MARPDVERLLMLRESVVGQIEQRLLGDAPTAELSDLRQRLQLIDGMLAERPRPRRHWAAPWWPVAMVAGVLLIAATVPVGSVPLTLQIEASSISFTMADPGSIGPLAIGGNLRVDGFTQLESGDAALMQIAGQQRPEHLEVSAAEMQLLKFGWPAAAQLTVQRRAASGAALVVESPRPAIVAELQVRGISRWRFADAEPIERDYRHLEWLTLSSGAAASPSASAPPPMSLELMSADQQALTIYGLRPHGLRFAERRASGGPLAVVGSSLDGGRLTLPASERSIDIASGDWLEIDGLVVERSELTIGSPLTLKLNGSARTLRLRVGEFERSLKPSWLEYLSRHHLAQLLWTSAALLWGALSWMRRQVAEAAK